LDFARMAFWVLEGEVATPRPAPEWFKFSAMMRTTVSTPAVLGLLSGQVTSAAGIVLPLCRCIPVHVTSIVLQTCELICQVLFPTGERILREEDLPQAKKLSFDCDANGLGRRSPTSASNAIFDAMSPFRWFSCMRHRQLPP